MHGGVQRHRAAAQRVGVGYGPYWGTCCHVPKDQKGSGARVGRDHMCAVRGSCQAGDGVDVALPGGWKGRLLPQLLVYDAAAADAL